MPSKKKTKTPRQFYGFTEGQEVTNKKTGVSYRLHGISMNGHANLIAEVYRKIREDYTEWVQLPLSHFEG